MESGTKVAWKGRLLPEHSSLRLQNPSKALCFSDDKTFTRKAAEAFAAMELERLYGKDEILELKEKIDSLIAMQKQTKP